MLLDDSEDEDPQVNFEMDRHLTDWITMSKSHGYRAELREKVKDDSRLSDEERIEIEKVNKEADFWLAKGIAIN